MRSATAWGVIGLVLLAFVVADATAVVERVWLLVGFVPLWIGFLELLPGASSDFVARKCCHAGCGLCILLFDTTDRRAQVPHRGGWGVVGFWPPFGRVGRSSRAVGG